MSTVTDSALLPGSEVAEPIENSALESAIPESRPSRRFIFFQAVPAWMISTLVHVIVILVLGLVTLTDPVKVINVLSVATSTDDGPEIEEFVIEAVDPGELAEPEEFSEETIEITAPTELVELAPMELSSELLTVPMELADLALEAAPSSVLTTLDSAQVRSMSSRSDEMKEKLLRDYGGNKSSEAAVTDALKWLARHQLPNGGWTFHHNLVCNGSCTDPGEPKYGQSHNAATSLALLPFLGAGQTHYHGEFREVVRRGLLFLVNNGRKGREGGLPVIDFRDRAGNMYSHGLASITLCEAYAMTEDPALAVPAQSALNYIVSAQGRDGGWRYRPRDPDGGDTSVVGWQVMALKSGHMGHLTVPPLTIKGAIMFLEKVQSNGGAMYGYVKPTAKPRPACTAIGLLCRMYTGWDKTHPGIIAGAETLGEIGVLKNDIYYDYYAAQVLRHYGGAQWDKFNVELRDWLVEAQAKQGGAKGSWHFPKSASHRGPLEGGRLASTAFSTMILEVYYRHMPLYADTAAEEEFPL